MKLAKHYNAVKEQLASGKSYSEVARQLGVSRQRVHQIAVKHDLEKIWKEHEPSQHAVRKYTFTLGPDIYRECRLKFSRKRQNCSKTRHDFTIEFDEISWPTHCPVLGLELDYYGLTGRKEENSVSFDRIDSNKGYIPGNVQIISWRANRIKNDGTADEHRKIADFLDNMINKTF